MRGVGVMGSMVAAAAAGRQERFAASAWLGMVSRHQGYATEARPYRVTVRGSTRDVWELLRERSDVAGTKTVLGRMANTENVNHRPFDGEKDAVHAPSAAVKQFAQVDSKVSRFLRE